MVYRCRNERGWPMTFVSDGAAALTGYSADAIESGEVNWAEDVLHEEDREEMWEQVQTAHRRGRAVRGDLPHRDRKRRATMDVGARANRRNDGRVGRD